MTNKPKHPDRFTRRMGQICIFGLGGFMAWAGLVPLEEGVSASGAIVVESNRQVVQHLEGGIVQNIVVEEGSLVERGDTLLVLQETASLASRDKIIQEIAVLTASIARLSALQMGGHAIDRAVLADLSVGEKERSAIISRENALFRQQVKARDAEIAVLATQLASSQTNSHLKANEIDITRRSLNSTLEELALFESLYEQQLARRDQIITLERRVSDFEGVIARLDSELAIADAQTRHLGSQIAQIHAQFDEEVASDLREMTAQLQAAEEAFAAAQDVLNRAIITAPVSGQIHNLAATTQGGVIAPGDTILEIVPNGESIVASVQVKPTDRAQVFEGLKVRTQISAYRSWKSPSLDGTVDHVSADLKRDPISGAAYYEARVRVDVPAFGAGSELEITPGMPVDIFIFSGKSRTTLDYLFEPISVSIFKGLRAG